MKKVIAILAAMIVLAGVVFATTGDTLTVNATVPVAKPEFTMIGGFTNQYGTTATGTLESQVNIAENPIDVYVQVKQTALSRYKNTNGFTVTIAATALSATIEQVTYSTAVPTITAASAGSAVVNAINAQKNDFTSTKTSETNGTVVFTVAYPTGAPVPANTVVGSIQYTWPATATLAVGSYSATITMSYEAP